MKDITERVNARLEMLPTKWNADAEYIRLTKEKIEALKAFRAFSERELEPLRSVELAIKDTGILIHESMHGHSPMEPTAYLGGGRVIEEISTCMSTTSVTRDILGVERDSPLEYDLRNHAGGYNKARNALLGLAQNELAAAGVSMDEKQVHALLEDSSLDFKRDHRKIHTTPEDAMEGFSRKVVARAKIPEASHKAFTDGMRRAYESVEKLL
jgi:hypothetical protein